MKNRIIALKDGRLSAYEASDERLKVKGVQTFGKIVQSSAYQSVPGYSYKARVVTADTGKQYYCFADCSLKEI